MKLLKPNWVTHREDQPIFSVDVHPDGSRLVLVSAMLVCSIWKVYAIVEGIACFLKVVDSLHKQENQIFR
jgi:hypothetical protein